MWRGGGSFYSPSLTPIQSHPPFLLEKSHLCLQKRRFARKRTKEKSCLDFYGVEVKFDRKPTASIASFPLHPLLYFNSFFLPFAFSSYLNFHFQKNQKKNHLKDLNMINTHPAIYIVYLMSIWGGEGAAPDIKGVRDISVGTGAVTPLAHCRCYPFLIIRKKEKGKGKANIHKTSFE